MLSIGVKGARAAAQEQGLLPIACWQGLLRALGGGGARLSEAQSAQEHSAPVRRPVGHWPVAVEPTLAAC